MAGLFESVFPGFEGLRWPCSLQEYSDTFLALGLWSPLLNSSPAVSECAVVFQWQVWLVNGCCWRYMLSLLLLSIVTHLDTEPLPVTSGPWKCKTTHISTEKNVNFSKLSSKSFKSANTSGVVYCVVCWPIVVNSLRSAYLRRLIRAVHSTHLCWFVLYLFFCWWFSGFLPEFLGYSLA